MRFCSLRNNGGSYGAIAFNDRVITFSELNARVGTSLPSHLFEFIQHTNVMMPKTSELRQLESVGQALEIVRFTAPFNAPSKILGIGLNYVDHAADLKAQLPSEPASFMKPRTTIIGPGDPIILPAESQRVTAEAELGVVIGKSCKNLDEHEAGSVVFGYVPVLDMTAEDILQRNPRFLTRAKSFDTFLSFGPFIHTPDEIVNLFDLTVKTVHNGRVVRSNKVRNMMFSPYKLIAFHSHVMTFEPGDIICTGTPGAAVIRRGDVVQCEIEGFSPLINPVT
jgi:2-keto-4-pentenoate hydratase/2-oxohepta-3-ene-1,7-dioic acid hydratase in catechol pathway